MEMHRKTIRDFWKQDGETVHASNEAVVKAWMKMHGFDTSPGSLSMLLHDKVHESARRALAAHLKVISKGDAIVGGRK